MIIKLGKKAKIFFKSGSTFFNEFGLWLEASILDCSSNLIPEEISNFYNDKSFTETLVIRDLNGNDFYLPQEEIEEIEYL